VTINKSYQKKKKRRKTETKANVYVVEGSTRLKVLNSKKITVA
jgi:hypothetical protein